tara:strand:+ start:316 stop:840 length:525 start_codon:yes stop_codon:yes gene_type:complete
MYLILFCISCKGSYKWEQFKKCIESAIDLMEYPKQVEVLGKAHHAIGNYQKKGLSKYEWNSYVYFGSRYEIIMSVEVVLNSDHSKIIKVLGDPEFKLIIYGEITKNSGGGIEADVEKSILFGKDTWDKVVKSGSNTKEVLAILGVSENKNNLPFFEDYYESGRPIPKQLINFLK